MKYAHKLSVSIQNIFEKLVELFIVTLLLLAYKRLFHDIFLIYLAEKGKIESKL